MAKKMKVEELALLPVRSFRTNGPNPETVAEYAALMVAGATFPALTVVEVGKKAERLLVVGAHRLAAATKAGIKELPVEVVKVKSEIEADFLSFRDNAAHGLLLTVEEKRKAILDLLQRPSVAKMSNASVARSLGVSDMTIGRYRDALGTKSPAAAKSGHKKSAVKDGVKVDKGGKVEAVPVKRDRASGWEFNGGSWSGSGAETIVSGIAARVTEGVSPKSSATWNQRMEYLESVATGLLAYAQSHKVQS